MRCPECTNRLVQSAADGTHVRAAGALVFKSDGTCVAKCHFCKAVVTLPLELKKAVGAPPMRSFVIDPARGPRSGGSA